jgi:hypothetical protein
MVIAIFLLVIGIAGLYAGITALSASSKFRGWPVASGRVTEKTIGPSTTTGASRPGRYFEPRVTYSYTVDGKSFTGHRIGVTTNAYDEDTARKTANDFPESVEVHYNPKDPSDALLQPSATGIAIIMLAAGILAALIGAGLLISSFSKS